MTDAYDGNGDYCNFTEEDEYAKTRKSLGIPSAVSSAAVMHSQLAGGHNGDVSTNITNDSNHLNDKAHEYLRDCINEKSRLERKFPISERLLDGEIEKVQTTGRIPSREQRYADIYREKAIRISQKVLVPIREHPKFNFVGKLLGPKGNSLRRLQEETLCKMTVLGRNSMRDRIKEEELRNSKDPKYAHLNSDLHVEISTVAPPAEAYARIAYAMAELRKYLIPDSNDMIRKEQFRELMDNAHISDDVKTISPMGYNKKISLGTGPHHQSSGTPVVMTGLSAVTGGSVPNSMTNAVKNIPQNSTSIGNYRITSGAQHLSTPTFVKNAMAPKQKVMSILEKARTAMEETYGRHFETDNMTYESTHSYETYNYGHGPPSIHNHGQPTHSNQSTGLGTTSNLNARGGPYDTTTTADYGEIDYNRRNDYYQQHSPSYGGKRLLLKDDGHI